jgi:nitrogen fixation/metabolism regulation signal transduction histidine kinase
MVVAGSVLLARSGLEGVFSATLFNTPKGILLLVIGPFSLIAFLGILLFGIISDSLKRNRTNHSGLRLFFAFVFVILCASVPQAFITGKFVSTALGSWFDASVSESLDSSAGIADLYVRDRNRTVELIASRYFNGLSIANWQKRPTDWMLPIREIDQYSSALQVYVLTGNGEDGFANYEPLIETGDSLSFVPKDWLDSVRDGFFNLSGDKDLLRYGQIVRSANTVFVCAYASLLPAGIEDRIAAIHTTREQAIVIDTLKPYLSYMGAWIFLMFCFPSVLMTVVLAFYLSTRFVEPVRALQEAAERIASGDLTFRLVTHTRDELAETARIINSIADSGSVGKRPDKKAVIRL